MKHYKIAVTILLFFSSTLFAGTTGKIAGRVTDAATGEPLPFANVIVMGTTMGAATDFDGYFNILNVLPGTYKVKASTIGYNGVTIEGVQVNIDLTTNLTFELYATSITLSEDVVVRAEQSVIKKDVASNQKSINTDEINALPVTNINDLLQLQAGIEPDLSVRGGDPNETLFMVDGFSMSDSRTNRPISNLPLSAVQQISVTTGGFSAEYANVRSGIVNVVTREGDKEKYQAVVNYRMSPATPKHFGISPYDANAYWLRPYLDPETAMDGTEAWDKYDARQYPTWDGWRAFSELTLRDDDPTNDLTAEQAKRIFEWQYRKQGDIKKPDYNIDFGFGGPVPFAKPLGNLRFFASFKREENQYLMELSRASKLDETMMIKLTSNLSKAMKLDVIASYGETYGTSGSRIGGTNILSTTEDVANTINTSSFTVPWRIHTNLYYSPTTVYNHMLSAKLTHVLSASTFYEVQAKKLGAKYYTTNMGYRDTTKRFEVFPGYFLDEAPIGFWGSPVTSIDGTLGMGGAVSTSRDFTETSTYSVRFDLVSQLDNHNQIKTGVEFIYDDFNMVFGQENFFLPEGNVWTNIKQSPYKALAFIQDKLEFEGLVATVGVLAEYSNPNGNWYNIGPYDADFFSQNYSPEDEALFKTEASEAQFTLSPRIAISHPITETSKLYFNYGHFYQKSVAENLYEERRKANNQLTVFGDPSTDQARTVAYELGFDQSLFDQFLLRVSGYYKDITRQEMYVRYISTDGKANYRKLKSNDYEDIFGFEVDLSRMQGDWIKGNINFEYRVGTSGYFGPLFQYENPSDQREYLRRNPSIERPRPIPKVKSWLDFHTPYNFGPKVFNQFVLGDWHANVITRWTAGEWDTWNPQQVPGIEYNVQWESMWNVDLKISKVFSFGDIDVKFFADIFNVFDLKQFSNYSFRNIHDRNDYMYSLHLPENVVNELGYLNNIPGNDQLGDYRPTGVDFVPIEWVSDINDPNINPNSRALYYDASTERYMQYVDGGWSRADAAKVQDVLTNKAYIDMPNQSFFTFLNPRNIFVGISVSYKL
ncbi:MAG: TonB-dependent receptor [Melioribacteraceae bacterium]|nr:TonB-dependent receptor [Melioribacteraceae bacterium]